MYRLRPESNLTTEMIVRYIEHNAAEAARKTRLLNYYKGKHDILKRTVEDTSKPNNKVVNPFAHYITDIMTGYFMGEPVAYNSKETEFLNSIKKLYNYNDEAAENSELAKDTSIFGEAYEMLYLDNDGEIRFKRLEPMFCIPIYDNTVEEELLYFIRHYDETDIVSGNTTTYIEVYSRNAIRTYVKALGAVQLLEETLHSFGAVPIVVYKNNDEQIGDFELVISLLDAYDKTTSDNINDLDYFVDAYLCLYGLEGTESDDIARMKQNRVLIMPQDAKAEWLVKSINDTYIENLKSRLCEDIHKFSSCPPMTDKDFSANASGVAIKYKLMALENTTSKKERAFKKGLQRRLELICNIVRVLGNDFDYRSIDIVFNRNIPSNLTEWADILNKIGHLFSEETQVSLLPLEIDYEVEKQRKEKEAEAGYSDYEEIGGEMVKNELLGNKSTPE